MDEIDSIGSSRLEGGSGGESTIWDAKFSDTQKLAVNLDLLCLTTPNLV